MQFKILNAESKRYSPDALNILKAVAEVDLYDVEREGLLYIIGAYDGLIIRLKFYIDEKIIESAKRLKFIATATTGLDHIDLEAAKRNNVRIISLKGEREFLNTVYATAELTWGLIIATLRNIPCAYNSVCEGEWNRDLFVGRELNGKVLGIIGLGRLGRKVANYGKAFGMTVKAYDPYETSFNNDIEKCMTLKELLNESHIITIHVPLNPETRGMIGMKEFSLIQQGGIIINTSRGDIIKEDALIEALKNNRIAGAALDVISDEKELYRNQHPLIEYAKEDRRLIITPHIGGNTVESFIKTEKFIAEEIKSFINQYSVHSA